SSHLRRSTSVKIRSRKRSPKRSITCSMRRMSIRSLPRPRIIAALTARSLDRVDDRVRPQCRDDGRQMLHIAYLDVDHDLEEVGRAVGDLQIADIAPLLADHCRQAAKITGLIGDRDIDAADMDRVSLGVPPSHIEPTLGSVGKA